MLSLSLLICTPRVDTILSYQTAEPASAYRTAASSRLSGVAHARKQAEPKSWIRAYRIAPCLHRGRTGEILGAAPKQGEVADAQLVALIASNATGGFSSAPTAPIPCSPRIGGRSSGSVDIRSGCQRWCRTVGWALWADRGGGPVPWRSRSALSSFGRMSGASPPVLGSGRALLGRQHERDALERLLDGGRAGRGCALVVHGEPGIGKTALLECAVETGREFRVASICGVESEMEMAFAALQQLCCPYLELMEHLPEPQRAALAVAFGLGAGRLQIRSWLDWRSSVCSPRLPRSSRFCASSIMRSGSIAPPRGHWPLWAPPVGGEYDACVCDTRAGRGTAGPTGRRCGLCDGDASALLRIYKYFAEKQKQETVTELKQAH